MGSCLSLETSRSRRRRRSRRDPRLPRGRRSAGEIHTQALKPMKPKWKSDIPITEGQLLGKRDEFWETAPAFEGRKEIWDALKAAASALETGDHSLAQAIVDGANILLPHGTLTDCYDELGNRYQLPVYVLSTPVNLIEGVSGDSENMNELTDICPGGKDVVVSVRLSSGKELKLKANTGESIHHLKKRIFELEGIEPSKQRFLFCGHLLVDRDRLSAVKIPKGFMLQVMIVEPIVLHPPDENGNVSSMLNGIKHADAVPGLQCENGTATDTEQVKIEMIESDKQTNLNDSSVVLSESESNNMREASPTETEETGPL